MKQTKRPTGVPPEVWARLNPAPRPAPPTKMPFMKTWSEAEIMAMQDKARNAYIA